MQHNLVGRPGRVADKAVDVQIHASDRTGVRVPELRWTKKGESSVGMVGNVVRCWKLILCQYSFFLLRPYTFSNIEPINFSNIAPILNKHIAPILDKHIAPLLPNVHNFYWGNIERQYYANIFHILRQYLSNIDVLPGILSTLRKGVKNANVCRS